MAVRQLGQRETVFLHSPGICRECDEARQSAVPYLPY
jgi:hypothetical protein